MDCWSMGSAKPRSAIPAGRFCSSHLRALSRNSVSSRLSLRSILYLVAHMPEIAYAPHLPYLPICGRFMLMPDQLQDRQIYRGGCHCGRIAYEVLGPLDGRISECNCSICTKKAYVHWIIPQERFRLLTPWEDLATYTFNTHAAKHH